MATFKPEWAAYFTKHPERYRAAGSSGRVQLYTRRAAPSGYFLRGNGTVEHLKNGFVVTPSSEELVVKFRHLPKLKSNRQGTIEIFAEPVFREEDGTNSSQQVYFVGLRVPPELLGSPITIAYRP